MARKSKEESKKFPEYYQKYFPSWTIEQCEEAAKHFKKSTNIRAIEYWIEKNPDKTKEECEKLRNEYFLSIRANNPKYIEYWNKQYPGNSEEDNKRLLKQHLRQTNYQCIEYWINKYPEKTLKECEEMLANKKKEYLAKRPDNSGENNPMHRSRVSLQKTKEGSPMCIEFYRKHFPNLSEEEQEKLWRKKHDKMAESTKNAIKTTNIEYYLNLGMSEEDAKKALHDRQCTFTLEKCIQKYGEEEGVKKYEERQIRWKNKLMKSFLSEGDSRSSQSVIANKLFDDISKLLNIKNPIKEKFIYDKKSKKGYAYDFCYGDKIIEFNGDYWHCNPKKYKENYVNKTIKLTAKEIWEHDYQKKIIAENFGYQVHYVWEMDYKKDPSSELIKCIKFLQS